MQVKPRSLPATALDPQGCGSCACVIVSRGQTSFICLLGETTAELIGQTLEQVPIKQVWA